MDDDLKLLESAIKANDIESAKRATFKIINKANQQSNDNGPSQSNATTPLHLACASGHLEIAKYAISLGDDINALSESGYTPLFIAAVNCHKEIAHLLIKSGANPDIAEKGSLLTALHVSIVRGQEDIARSLINADANPNARDKDDTIPLHESAFKGLYEISRMLILAGSDTNIKDKYGNTPIDMAAMRGNSDIVVLLSCCGADINSIKESFPEMYALAKSAEDNVLLKRNFQQKKELDQNSTVSL